MSRYRIEYNNHTMKDFIDVWFIERQYFKHNTIAPPKQDKAWDEKNNDIHIFIRDIEINRIIAEVVLIPLTKKQFTDFMNNKLKDLDLNYNTIEIYKNNKSYYLLLCAIAISKNYRNDKQVLSFMLQGIYNKICCLKKRRIKFKNFCAEFLTTDGLKFNNGFIKLKERNTTLDGYKLCCFENSKEMKEWFKVFPKYIEQYNKTNHIHL